MDGLIERDDELAVLGEVIAEAIAGGGGAVLVEGEAGIGKTRLLAPARARAAAAGAAGPVRHRRRDRRERAARRRPRAARARGARRRAGRTGAAGRARAPGCAGRSGGLGSRADEVVHALWWLIVELADEQPLVLMVDDAQWADDLTLGLLRMIARRAGELPLALIVAARPAAPGPRHASLAASAPSSRFEPAALSVAGTARLLEEVLGRPEPVALVGAARALTGGNPLYLSRAGRAGAAGDDARRRPPAAAARASDRATGSSG